MYTRIRSASSISVLCAAFAGCAVDPAPRTDPATANRAPVAATAASQSASRSLVEISAPVSAVVNRSFVSPLVESFGAISIGQGVFISGNTIVRADPDTRICIGDETNLQDNILFLALRKAPGVPTACGSRSSSTASRVSIAHQAVIVNSSIGPFTFVGFRARVENSTLEEGAFVLHGAIVSNVRIPRNRIVPIGGIIRSQAEADALPLKTDAHAKFQEDVLHVNREFAEHYGRLYEVEGFDSVTGISVAPKTSFNPKGTMPTLGSNVVVSEFARIVGDVRLGSGSTVGRRTSIRADEGTPIVIGANARIDDRVTFHALEHTSLVIGANLKAGHNVVFHGPLEVGDRLDIADNAILFRSKVGHDVAIGEGAIVVDVTLRDGVKVPDHAVITSQDKADALYWPVRR